MSRSEHVDWDHHTRGPDGGNVLSDRKTLLLSPLIYSWCLWAAAWNPLDGRMDERTASQGHEIFTLTINRPRMERSWVEALAGKNQSSWAEKKTDPVLSRKFKGNKNQQQESPPALKLTRKHRKSNKAREHNREKNNTNQTKQGKKQKKQNPIETQQTLQHSVEMFLCVWFLWKDLVQVSAADLTQAKKYIYITKIPRRQQTHKSTTFFCFNNSSAWSKQLALALASATWAEWTLMLMLLLVLESVQSAAPL